MPESGQILAIVAVLLLGMLAIVGLVVDSGLVYSARRQARRAADAAAQAGAFSLVGGTNAAQRAIATAVALQYAGTNGINTNGYVVVQTPPEASSNSTFVGSNGYIFVQVTVPVNTTFLRLLSTQRTVNVTAAATGGILMGLCPLSVLVLHPSDSGALRITGGGQLVIPGGTIGVNSSSASAVTTTGGSSLSCSNLNIVGSYSGTVVANFVHTHVSPMMDPFQYLSLPTIVSSSQVIYGDGTVGSTSPDSGGTAASPSNASPSGTKTLRPGIYWGGMKITGGNLTFLPGRYVLAGGGFSISGSPTIQGTNVVFYNTRDPYSGSGSADYGQISIAGSSGIALKAPPTAYDSTYGGFLFINDRANNRDINLSGGSSTASSGPLSGFFYAPASTFKVTGGGYLGGIGAVVLEINVSGNSQFTALDISRIPGVASAGLAE